MTKILITKLKGIIGNGVKYLHEGELARKDEFERPMVKLGDKGSPKSIAVARTQSTLMFSLDDVATSGILAYIVNASCWKHVTPSVIASRV